jgi:hypothetical protein
MVEFDNSNGSSVVKENTDDPIQDQLDKDGLDDLNQISDGPFQVATKDNDPNGVQVRLEQITSKLMGDFVNREAWRRTYEYNLWWEEYRLFQSAMINSKTPTRTKIFIPIFFQVIQVATSKLIGFISTNDTLFDVEAKEVKEQVIANNIKMLIGDQLDQNKFSSQFVDFVMQLIIYGTSFLYCDWEVRREWKWVREPKGTVTTDEFGISITTTEYIPVKKYMVTARRPRIKVLDILDVYPQQDFADIEDMPGIFVRTFVDEDSFPELFEGEDPFLGNQVAAIATGTSMQYQTTRQYRKATRGEMATTTSRQVELLEYWGPYDLDGDGIKEECQIIICNRKVCVRAVPNPFHHGKRPVIKCVFSKVPLEFYGNSLVEPIISLQHELNTVRRQKLDAVNLCINRMWLANENSTIEESQLIARPGGVIWVDNFANLQQLPAVEIPQSAYQDAQLIMQDMFAVTVPQSLQGSVDAIKGNGSNSVGAVKMDIGQALEKFATAAKNIEDSAIKPLLDMMYDLDLQFLNTSEVIRAFYGYIFPDPAVVSPGLIYLPEPNFKMTVLSEMIGKDTKINQQLAFYQTFGPILNPQSQQTIAKQIWELLGFDGDAINVAAAAGGPTIPGAAPTGNIPGAPPAPGAGNVNPGNVVPPVAQGNVPTNMGPAAATLHPAAGTTPASMGVKGVTNLPLGPAR